MCPKVRKSLALCLKQFIEEQQWKSKEEVKWLPLLLQVARRGSTKQWFNINMYQHTWTIPIKPGTVFSMAMRKVDYCNPSHLTFFSKEQNFLSSSGEVFILQGSVFTIDSHIRNGDISDSFCNFPSVPWGQGWPSFGSVCWNLGTAGAVTHQVQVLSPGFKARESKGVTSMHSLFQSLLSLNFTKLSDNVVVQQWQKAGSLLQ